MCHGESCGSGGADPEYPEGGNMYQKMNMSERNKRIFLDGLKKYQDRGIPVLIDGRQADDDALEKIFEQDERGFYMGDYILEETPRTGNPEPMACPLPDAVYEARRDYLAGRHIQKYHLKEIHFDKVYHR